MTRDGFTLLAMGFTGEKALRWKLRYLRAFNAMEAELRHQPPASSVDKSLIADVVMLRASMREETARFHRVSGRLFDELEKMADAHERIEGDIKALTFLRADTLNEIAKLATARADAAADEQHQQSTQVLRRKPGRPRKFI